MKIQHFFDEQTFSLSYVVFDESCGEAVIIDPVLDYDPASGETNTQQIKKIVDFVEKKQLDIKYLIETHVHADHLSGSMYLKQHHYSGAKIVIGSNIVEVQATFKNFFGFPESFKVDGSQFDVLLNDEQSLEVGSFEVKGLHTPGHTPACMSLLIGDNLFTGDTMFMPDYGTGRCDFPGGSAEKLFESIHDRIYKMDESVKVYVGHDYQPNARPMKFMTTVGESKRENIQLNMATSRQDFVDFRSKRDKTLSAPKLLYQSIQVNAAAGNLPEPDSNGRKFLKIPITDPEPF